MLDVVSSRGSAWQENWRQLIDGTQHGDDQRKMVEKAQELLIAEQPEELEDRKMQLELNAAGEEILDI